MDKALQAKRPRMLEWPVALVASGLLLMLTVAYSLYGNVTLDHSISSLINAMADRSRVFDHFFLALTQGNFVSGSVMVGLIWYAWFQYPALHDRAQLLTGTAAAVLFGMGSRVLQLTLPSHLRPLHDPLLAFRIPAGVNPGKLSGWSSFPSDHAAVYFGLAYVLYRSNPRLGVVALVSAALFDFARVYLGYHYASDIVGGAALGVLGAAASLRPAIVDHVAQWLRVEVTRPGLFYMVAFILSFGLGSLFFDARVIADGIVHDLGF